MCIETYEDDWNYFQKHIEDKVKDRCELTNKNWMKLREYHMDTFLKGLDSPFTFLFKVKHFNTDKYNNIHCMDRFFFKYKKLHFDKFQVNLREQ